MNVPRQPFASPRGVGILPTHRWPRRAWAGCPHHEKRAIAFVLVPALTALAVAPATPPAFDARLDAVNAKAKAITSLRADFVQEKKSPLLRKPLVSRGTVTAKGDSALWQTTAPEASTLAATPKLLRLYFPARQTIEEYPVQGQLGLMATSPLPGLDAIRENFTLAPDAGDGLTTPADPPDTLATRLTPRGDALKQYVDHVRVLLDAAHGVVLAFEVTDPDGEVTLIRFKNVRTDEAFADDALTLKAPPGTKTVRPLGDNGAGIGAGRP